MKINDLGLSGPLGRHLQASWGVLGGLLGSLKRIVGRWRHLEAVLGASRDRLGPPGRLSEGSWGLLGALLGRLGRVWGQSWGSLGPSWGSLGGLLGRLGVVLGASWAVLERRRAETARKQKT